VQILTVTREIRHAARWQSKAAAALLGLAMCAVPVSIAVTECFLGAALLFRVWALVQREAKLYLPAAFWYWSVWAGLEVFLWLSSGAPRTGSGEMRHLLLIAALFVLVGALPDAASQVAVWCGIAWTATLGSAFVIGHFVFQLLFYRGPLDPVVYLRSGGLLHHWMIYGTVEVLVFAGLLELWHYFPEKHWWLLPVLIVNAVAMLVSLTRMVWICAALLLSLHLIWRRSRWIWAVPALLCALFFAAPEAVRSRVIVSMKPDYYSNAERLQMLRVGWKMIRERPLTGVGPGRVEGLYAKYLSPSEPLPAYHGHLHNNAVELAAEFGLLVIAAALLFLVILTRDLLTRHKLARDREQLFVCRTSLLALAGFLATGLFDYTWGHSLGLILLAFAVLSPLARPASQSLRTNVPPVT
jgi:O-antigen ligase